MNHPSSPAVSPGACEGQTMKQKNTSLTGESGQLSTLYLLWRNISLTCSSLWLNFSFFFFLVVEMLDIWTLKNLCSSQKLCGNWWSMIFVWFPFSHILPLVLFSWNYKFFLFSWPFSISFFLCTHCFFSLILSLVHLMFQCSTLSSDCVLCIFSGRVFFQNWLWRNLVYNLAIYISFC